MKKSYRFKSFFECPLHWLLVCSLEVKVQVNSFEKRGSNNVSLFSRNQVLLCPLQEALLWGVHIVVDAVKRGPLGVLRVPEVREGWG